MASVGTAAGLLLRPSFAASQDLTGLTLKKASELFRSGAVSAVELTQACLNRIEKYNPTLNAFTTVTADHALTAARQMGAEQRRRHWRGPVHPEKPSAPFLRK